MNTVAVPNLPAPSLDADKLARLTRELESLTAAQLYWIAAWSAAQAEQVQRGGGVTPAPAGQPASRLTIVYGSQTGNAKRIAEQLASRGEAAGLPVRLLRADAYPQRELAQERHLLLVISTQGDGEPPDDARGLFEFISGKRAPKLPALQFAVLGLGDSSYPQFCTIGRQLDARLAELGGSRLASFGEADVEIEAVAAPWVEQALEQAREQLRQAGAPARATPLHVVPSRSTWSREQPFAATVLANQRIVARDSARDVRHVELSLEGSGLHYQPGDALGVWPHNPPALVEQWLEVLQLDGAQPVTHQQRTLPLRQWLGREREITRLHRGFISALATAGGHDELARLLQPEQSAQFAAVLADEQPIDLLRRYPAPWQAEALLATLRPLAPRLYSIASSTKAVGEEVHLTVAVVDYEAHGSTHWGAASSLLAATGEDGTLPVFIESNERFRLPTDGSRDIIMIGPGTGVAPFRAFVQERRESGATGRNWLFFGNRHFASDFLYQLEWQQALKDGSLHRLDLAFSRDPAFSESPHKEVRGVAVESHKTYVQDRLREHGAELHAWLKNGAHLYVCGDAKHMARDVHAALVDVIVAHGNQSPEEANAWLGELLQQGRYARDVY
ncbi:MULTISPECIES: assimilatory sulfite reductase (NADPH) flavoprotein subunit [Rhodanobacter]|uniref:assimilatory sulfite reductase (NADPH) flavoprotein subunit n=2 Tax=Rhodanobacteraceae TaxID=1775411 RepID=UPI001202E9A7|nr:assimilatory sulfite reductase (NADPH) flavoprotein subunit [Rhodanobacter thiooxydans]TAN15579.1 MAG: assimilatory sulfite reductase (NADPH) flavoprotein subunit [Rhodanobacter sp.]UJJ53183.1 assimilatory sulfite reductase (NADPH) flavoprotein subunit [Rhodanobacter thiooxydans]